MKIIVCGKGGSGKSTLSALMAIEMKNRGCNVLLIDADESNFGLHRLMGASDPVTLLDSFGGKKGLKQKTASVFPAGTPPEPFDKMMRIDELPDECIVQADGVRLLVVGKIHHFGEGCACPMGLLSKMVLSKLVVEENEVVLIDAAAGVEHFGRRVDADCDLILGVVDPTYESFTLANRMMGLAAEAGIEIRFVLNKVDEDVEATMTKNVDQNRVIARIFKNQAVFMSSLEGNKMAVKLPEIDPICQWIENFKKVKNR